MKMIFASTPEGGIGFENALPWPRISKDMEYFKQVTMGGTIIYGRKTFESFGSKPLPGRMNVIISKTLKSEDVIKDLPEKTSVAVFQNIEEALRTFKGVENVWVIGGAEIYQYFAPYITYLSWTEIARLDGEVMECDTFVHYEDMGADGDWVLESMNAYRVEVDGDLYQIQRHDWKMLEEFTTYESRKITDARPCTGAEYARLLATAQGSVAGGKWNTSEFPAEAEGYQVIYSKGEPEEYISWCPKDVFEKHNTVFTK